MRDFAFTLCERLGWPHPDFLLSCLTYEQFAQWQDYYQRNPWGEGRADQRQAVLLQYLFAPFMRGGKELPSLQFPYFESIDPQAALDWQREFDANLRAKPGGGYEYIRPLEDVIRSTGARPKLRPLPETLS